jgi:drug/metabolite transporter (DMT)-like permease
LLRSRRSRAIDGADAGAVDDNPAMSAASLFATCVLIWGTTWYAITLQLSSTSPAVGVALRFSLAAALIFLWCMARGHRLRLPRATHAWLALMGLLNFCVSYLLVYYAEQRIVSGLVAVGYSAMPLLNMALSRLFFGTPTSGRVGLGGLLGIGGIALIFWPEFARFAADAPLLAGAAFTALAVLASGLANMVVMRNQSAGIDGWAALAYAMTYGALGTWTYVALTGDPVRIVWSGAFVASLFYLAALGSALAFGAYFALLRQVGPARAAYVGVMSTIVALLVSAALEGYDWTAATAIGIALAVAGNVLAMNRSVESAA